MSNKVLKETEDFKQRDNYIKQQLQLKAMKPTGNSKVLSADSMIEDLLSKKETFQKKTDCSSKAKTGPPWINPDNKSLIHPMYMKVWEIVKSQMGAVDTLEVADTSLLSSLLMTSGLSTDMLGFIWSLANNTVPGVLTQTELYMVLALVALAQSGYVFNNISILNQLPQPPLPNLNLAIISQLKGGLQNSSIAVQSPVGIPMTSINKTTNDFNYFNQFPTAIDVQNIHGANSILPLDVNHLQSAPSLTLPNSFGFSANQPSQNMLQQNFGKLQSSQQSFNVSSTSGFQSSSPVQSGITNAIPSISLGISLPNANHSKIGTPGVIQQQNETKISSVTQQTGLHGFATQASTVSNSLLDATQNKGMRNTGIDHFEIGFSSQRSVVSGDNINEVKSNFSELRIDDLKNNSVSSIGVVPKRNSNVDSDSFNVDESFDSLSTERASTNISVKPVNSLFPQTGGIGALNTESQLSKPNYDINLFESYNDIKQIFPDSQERSSDLSQRIDSDDKLKGDSLVTHNPVYNDEENAGLKVEGINITTGSLASSNFSTTNLITSGSVDDDFTDFQSADFNAFNSFPCASVYESADNFSDFQQASAVSSSSSGMSYNKNGNRFQGSSQESSSDNNDSNVTNDDDLFPSLNLKLENSIPKVMEMNDGLSIKSIDISIVSSDNNTEMNPSPVSNDYDSQDSKKDETKFKSDSNNEFSSFKVDKTFLSLSSSIVFDNTNTSSVGDNVQQDLKRSLQSNEHETSQLNSGAVSLQSHSNDKYSALRMLETSPTCSTTNGTVEDNVNDDFGDFIAAEPVEQEQLQLPDLSGRSDQVADAKSTEVKCLEACLNILEKSFDILKTASTPEVLNQILTDPRGNGHLSCLVEVYKISERLMQHADCKSTTLAVQVQSIWNMMNLMVPDNINNYNKQAEENLGPKCGVCKCNYGPTPVRYGLNYYHPPCANLYLRYVSPMLPSVLIS